MAKQTKITRFNGGKVEDLRTQSSIASSITQHFDIRNEHKLIPYLGFIANEDVSGASKGNALIQRFLYVNGSLFGYGRNNSTNKFAKLYELSSGLSGTWQGSSDGTSSAGARRTEVFFAYKNIIYGFDENGVWSYDTTTDSFSDSDVSNIGSIASSDVLAEPVQHPGDDIAYFFKNNEVYTNDDGSWSASAVLTLPSNLDIVSADTWGNYIAIAQRPQTIYDKRSVVSFWNRNTSLTVVSEEVHFTDRVQHIANLRDRLISVGSSFEGDGDGGVVFLYIRDAVSGNILKTYRFQTIRFAGNKIVDGDVLYFPMEISDENSETRMGIWAVQSDGTLTLDQVVEDASGVDISSKYQGIYKAANRWFVGHSDDGSIEISGSVDDGFTNTSVWESVIFTGGDSSKEKQIKGVAVSFEPLESGAQVTLKYRVDEEISDGSAFTTVESESTEDEMRLLATHVNDGGAFKNFNELQWRIESTGGAVITSIKWIYEDLNDEIS